MKFLTQVAQTPPMGWNSFDCYGSAITEAEFRANVDYLATHLKPHGWEYAVIDFCWSHPAPGACHNPHQGPGFTPMLHTDRWGRLMPAVGRFPSAAGGLGFKPRMRISSRRAAAMRLSISATCWLREYRRTSA